MTPGLSPDPRLHVAGASYGILAGALSHALSLLTMAPLRTYLTHKQAL